jgi:hypothetical protein
LFREVGAALEKDFFAVGAVTFFARLRHWPVFLNFLGCAAHLLPGDAVDPVAVNQSAERILRWPAASLTVIARSAGSASQLNQEAV